MADDVFVTGDMKTFEVLEKYPEAEELLAENGMFCAGCWCAEAETLEQACALHCMDTEAVIEALNERIRNSRTRR